MDVKRKATEGIVAIPAKKAKNELALRYGTGNDYDENVSSCLPECLSEGANPGYIDQRPSVDPVHPMGGLQLVFL